jgi:hypothetical protein
MTCKKKGWHDLKTMFDTLHFYDERQPTNMIRPTCTCLDSNCKEWYAYQWPACQWLMARETEKSNAT